MWKLKSLTQQSISRRNDTAAAVVAAAAAVTSFAIMYNGDTKKSIKHEQKNDVRLNRNGNNKYGYVFDEYKNKWNLVPQYKFNSFNLQEYFRRDQSNVCQCEPSLRPKLSIQSLKRRSTLVRLNQSSAPIRNLNAKYKVSWKIPLGEGAFSTVYEGTNRQTKEKVAIKKIPKMFTDTMSFQNEIDALLHIQENGGHPHICSLNESFEDDKNFYLVLDLVTGGEMFDHLIKLGAYSEADSARLVSEAAMALCFIHGIGVVHGDLKPENLMLSTDRQDCSIQLVDFGCAHIISENEGNDSGCAEGKERKVIGGNTPAYCPPEALVRTNLDSLAPSVDMWSLGIILYIMLTGLHPFDLNGNATDEEVEKHIKSRQSPPLRNSPITAHLSSSAIDVIERCINWDPQKRITAQQLLNHPWVMGETAREDKMTDASKKLSMYHKFKSKLEAKVFANFITWSNDDIDNISKKTSLIERAFHSIDVNNQGFLTNNDLKRQFSKDATTANQTKNDHEDKEGIESKEGEESNRTLSLSGFSNLLNENMKNRFFPTGTTVYRESDIGNHMYFINSGIIEVTTKDGSRAIRRKGDFFGEGALLHPKRIRSASINCLTPVHAIEISREYFEKYSVSSGLNSDLKEKDKTRKRNRAKTILRLQKNLNEMKLEEGDVIFSTGEEANALYILESGVVDILVGDKKVFHVKPGDVFGEHSIIMGRPRNTSAKCITKECVAQEMKARDFYELYNSSSTIRTPLRELCLRREFQKALVNKTKKEFPSVADLRNVFDAADSDKSGSLALNEVRALLKSFDPTLSENEIKEVLQTLDLEETGLITFNEFKLIFGMNESRAASI